jgi:hypothetical protein
MPLLNLIQNPKIIQPKQNPTNNHNRPCHNARHSRSNAPNPTLLSINIDQRTHQPSKTIQTSWEKDAIQEPDIVCVPTPPEPDHTRCADGAAYCGDDEELDVFYGMEDCGCGVGGGDFWIVAERL